MRKRPFQRAQFPRNRMQLEGALSTLGATLQHLNTLLREYEPGQVDVEEPELSDQLEADIQEPELSDQLEADIQEPEISDQLETDIQEPEISRLVDAVEANLSRLVDVVDANLSRLVDVVDANLSSPRSNRQAIEARRTERT